MKEIHIDETEITYFDSKTPIRFTGAKAEYTSDHKMQQ